MHGGHIICICYVVEWECYDMLHGALAGQSLTQKSDQRLCLHGGSRAGGALHAPPETENRRPRPAKTPSYSVCVRPPAYCCPKFVAAKCR